MNAKRFAIRMKKELEVFTSNPPRGICCCPKEANKVVLEAVIIGPEGSAYEGGIFHLDLNIPDEYPFYPPRVRFLTKVYHPNIDEHGRICLDILKVPPNGCWRCTCSIANVLIGIQCLLSEPNAEDPLNPDIANVYTNNRELFIKTAKEFTQRYAKFERPPVLPDPVVSSIREMDKEYERESINEPGPSTSMCAAASSSKISLSSIFQPHSSSPKLSIMEPDLLESDDEKDMNRGPGSLSKLCLPSTSKQSLDYYPQVSRQLSIMEPDLMDSESEEEKSMYEPGPSTRLFLPSRSLPEISSIFAPNYFEKLADHNEPQPKYEMDPNMPSTSGLNLKRGSDGSSESEEGSQKKYKKSP